MARVKTSVRTSSGRSRSVGPFRSVGDSAQAILKTLSLPSQDQVVVRFPFAPKQLTFDNVTVKTVELRRPNQKPLLAIENPQLRTCTFNVVIADKQSGGALSAPVIGVMEGLESMAANGYDCKFAYGLLALSYSVKITRLTFETKQLNSDGEPIRVEAQIQLTESPTYNPELVALDVVYHTPDITPTIPSQPAPEPVEDDPEREYEGDFGTGPRLPASIDLSGLGTQDEINAALEEWNVQKILSSAGFDTSTTLPLS